ncbi:hypothetical protein [Streptomyces sp. NPDC050263]|uniref:hypothetical protein n=1 Tax=Streptomyces sp. NPDC050263 TaxID=3155037 RepID=UPI003449FB01
MEEAMIPGRSSIEALITGRAFMRDIGMLFPVSVTLRGDEFAAVLMMHAGRLGIGPPGRTRPTGHRPTRWTGLSRGRGSA